MMRPIALIFFWFLFLNGFSQNISTWFPSGTHMRMNDGLRNERASLSSAQISDIIYSRMRFRVDPAVQFIAGEVTHHFFRNNCDTLYLMLSDSLVVDSVVLSGVNTQPVRTGNHVLLIPLFERMPKSIDSVSVYYRGRPPTTGFGSFVTEKHNGVPVLWTLSQPYGASDWWPCQNTLLDKTDSIDMFVTCPVGNKVASNGLLVSVDTLADQTEWHWSHHYPVADYLVAFAVTNYAYYEENIPIGSDTLLIVNYVYPEDSADRRLRTGWIHDVYPLYTALFGTYPFIHEKYGHAEFGRGGGMEHQTMTFIAGFSYDVMVHELAHQWFGDAITCGSWYDLWLNEGWATYATGLAYEHLQGGIYWDPWKTFWRQKVTSLPDGVVQTVDSLDVPRLFDERLTYGKAAYVLHMLRWVMTDTCFFDGVRSYLSDASLLMGFAKTADFQAHMEAASGLDLEHFFDVWLRGEGYPIYSIRWGQNSDTITVHVHQQTTHSSVSFFKMSLPLNIYTEEYDSLFILNNTTQDQEFKIVLPFDVDSIVFNRDQWLLTQNSTVTGFQSIDNKQLLNVYPNPVHERLSVFIPASGEMTIFDPIGRIQYKCNYGEKGLYIIDIEYYKSGIYHLVFTSGGNRQVAKLIVI